MTRLLRYTNLIIIPILINEAQSFYIRRRYPPQKQKCSEYQNPLRRGVKNQRRESKFTGAVHTPPSQNPVNET